MKGVVRMRNDRKCFTERSEFLATDDICGNFSFTCGNANFLVWDSVEVVPVGTVSVFHTHGCASLLSVTVTDSDGHSDTFEVPPGNTRSRTYANLVSVTFSCSTSSESTICEGRYCLDLHYLIRG